MAAYGTKIVNYGYKEKVTVYGNPIPYGKPNPVPSNGRQKYGDMPEHKKKHSDNKRVKYYKKKVVELIEIAIMNPDLDVFITLTFKKSIKSYDMAISEWQLFLKRLRHLYPHKPLKYICVWEYQKNRSRKEHIENGKGIFHFHALMNLGYIEFGVLEKVWGQGFVYIESIADGKDREKAIKYTLKYCAKELVRQIESGADSRGKRFFFTSNNLLKPVVSVSDKKQNLDDIIFEHMEDMITDSSYDIVNEREETINHAEYVIFKK